VIVIPDESNNIVFTNGKLVTIKNCVPLAGHIVPSAMAGLRLK